MQSDGGGGLARGGGADVEWGEELESLVEEGEEISQEREGGEGEVLTERLTAEGMGQTQDAAMSLIELLQESPFVQDPCPEVWGLGGRVVS